VYHVLKASVSVENLREMKALVFQINPSGEWLVYGEIMGSYSNWKRLHRLKWSE